MTGNENGRPGGKSGAAVETNSAGGGAVEAIVERRTDEAPREGRRRKPLGIANASVGEPNHGREKWRAWARCTEDGVLTVHPYDHLEDVAGSTRRGACGHRYVVVVRQVLREYGEVA